MSYRHIKEGSGKGRYQDFTFQGSIEEGAFSLSPTSFPYHKPTQSHTLEEFPTLTVEARFNGNLKQVLIDQSTHFTLPLTEHGTRSPIGYHQSPRKIRPNER